MNRNAVGLLFLVAILMGLAYKFQPADIEDVLIEAEETMSADCPKMIGNGIRLDKVSAGPGLRLTHHYTMVNDGLNDLDTDVFNEKMREKLIILAKENPNIGVYRDGMVDLVFEYTSNDNFKIATITLKPGEY